MTDRLVDGDWLEAHLTDERVRILDIGSSGEGPYRQGHAPGAVWAFWKDLCWHETDRRFPTADDMAARLGALGIGDGDTVVLMSDKAQHATYAYWTLTMTGHADVRVLDGSRRAWIIQGRPLSVEIPAVEPVEHRPGEGDASSRVGRDDVLSCLHHPARILLDVRSPEEYRGERVKPLPDFDHGAERKGRIPGARHLYYRRLIEDDETFRTPDEIRDALAEVGVDPDGDREVVCYCRLSHRATLVWFALSELVGRPNTRIYDGSWTEWGSIVGFPVER